MRRLWCRLTAWLHLDPELIESIGDCPEPN
jgi:hypothetical protein